MRIVVTRNGDVYQDTITHDNSFADIYRGTHAIKAEIERLIAERRQCPHNPKISECNKVEK